ncbi:D-2-hydroxyacid dehydrogenase [Trichocoleus sp. Lan]|uniref:D-2-hydroxyacid dehydrogenase n=1 Tax=Trichocoleus sp. Lan TaxID=2933927 RepID=UPI00329805A2
MKLIIPTEIASDIEPRLPPNLQVVRVDSEGNLDGDASDAEVYFNWILLKPTTLHKVLAAAPTLRWQHTPSAGVNHILTPTFLEREITLTNGAGVHAIPIAEFVLMFMLYHAKNLPQLQAFQAERNWGRGITLKELKDATLLIIGAGSIGVAIAQRASSFGMRVWGSRRHPEPLPEFDKVVSATEWRSLLPEADYVVVSTPLTPETKGTMDAAVFQAMRSSAFFINIARGAIVDEAALLTALREGWIAGAALDTFSAEPLPPDSPFWSLPNVFISPHCSADSPQTYQRSLELFLENLSRYQAGLPLRNVVDKQVGY